MATLGITKASSIIVMEMNTGQTIGAAYHRYKGDKKKCENVRLTIQV